ncbi:hypothetical protein [Paenibacillus xerothermodurans]|uniref:Transcriptional regulator n=1 Tax=Paenibacillus xerothermodurans TaxID=1977292 RepID=A0A2W1NTY2_PAEXE|nr:hypothetical protein [Paenibacillus xerothermodurans]PZE22103.1 transcriptional regulator [Paenibacillus xerothermodurans]
MAYFDIDRIHTLEHFFDAEPPVIDPTLQRILDYLNPCPAFIADRYCTLLGWNKAAGLILDQIGPLIREDRNIVWLSLMKQELRELVVNWEDFAGDFLTMLRNYQGQYRWDPWYDDFIRHCKQASPHFSQLWHMGESSTDPNTIREVNHPQAGNMRFELTSFQVYAQADLRCCIYTPIEDSETETKITNLLRVVN